MRIRIASWISLIFLAPCTAVAQKPGEVWTKRASNSSMLYLVSLPKAWKAGQTYPVVVSIEDAERDFPRNMKEFLNARGSLPFILVVPEVVTNGGSRYREATTYGYSQQDWDQIVGSEWKFDDDGLAAVIADVHRLYGGETQYYLTGWEAGGHTVFAEVFNHPDRVLAAALVCPNYQARHVAFSSSRARPPIRVFAGDKDQMWGEGNPLFDQTKRAESEGNAHGYHFSYEMVPGKGHEPLADAVLKWFLKLQSARHSN